MASVAELSNAVFLAALVIVLLDSTTIGGLQFQCIVVSDAQVILKGGSNIFEKAGRNLESLRRCECGEDVWKTLEEINYRLKALGDPARKLAELNHRVNILETSRNDVVDLKNDVTSIQKDIQTLKQGLNEASSNLLPSVPLPSLDEVIKKVEEEEDNIRRLKMEVSEGKSDRGDLRDSFERMKREVAKERSETNLTVASIRARIDSLDRAGQRVIGILRASKSFSDNFIMDKKDVAKSQEVSPSVPQRMEDQIQDESTKFMIDSARVPRAEIRENNSRTNATAEYVAGSVTENGASTAFNTSQVLSVSEESQRRLGEDVKEIEFVRSEGGFPLMPNGEEVAACTKFDSTNDPLSPSLPAACSNFSNRTENASVGSLESVTLTTQDSPHREWPLERAMILLAAQLLDLQKSMAASRLDDKVAGLEQHADKVDASLSNLGHLVSVCEANVTRAFDATETAVSNITELIEETLQTFRAQIFTKFKNHTAHLQKSTGVFQESIGSFRGKLQAMDTRISEFNGSFQEAASLTVRLNETLHRLKTNVRKLTKDYNSSITNTDLSLREKINELERHFTSEIERVNQVVQNMTNVAEQRPRFYGYGWHPDDSQGCPGLKSLATDGHLVLSTEFGRFVAPKLPTDLLPTDSVVRFRCSPAGSQRLVGAEELRCLGGGRWSHRPPVCQRLPTLDQLQKGDKSNEIVPSILYSHRYRLTEWILIDDDGNLVLFPNSTMRLVCLYPPSKGDVVWLHKGMGVNEDEAFIEAVKKDFLYVIRIPRAMPEHSGEYSCQAPDGKRRSVKIKVAAVECEAHKDPVNGRVFTTPWRRVIAGDHARFSCHSGYHLVGEDLMFCLGNGRWSAPVPTCEED